MRSFPIETSIAFVLAACAASLVLTYLLVHNKTRFNILDYPNERSLHQKPVPRTGGLALITCVAVAFAAAIWIDDSGRSHIGCFAPALALVALTSLLDDNLGLSPGVRLVAQVLAAVFLLLCGAVVPDVLTLPGWSWHWPLAVADIFVVLFVVWMINLYNFMDGMDGYAAGMAVIGFLGLAILGAQGEDPLFTILTSVVASSAAGFLVFNFPRARIFLGDSGSSTLGFLAASFSLWADEARVSPLWLSALIFSPFIVDATVTLVCRLGRRDRIWTAHKTHYYQRLVQIGWSHRRTSLLGYLIMMMSAVSAILAMRFSANVQWLIIITWCVAYALVIAAINSKEKQLRRERESR